MGVLPSVSSAVDIKMSFFTTIVLVAVVVSVVSGTILDILATARYISTQTVEEKVRSFSPPVHVPPPPPAAS